MVRDYDRYTDRDKRTVPEAARLLGITQDAVRKRITRGTISHTKDEDGRVWVYLYNTKTTQYTDQDTDRDKLLEVLRDQVEMLRDQLAHEREANRENRRIIAGLTSRIPQLEAPTTQAQEQRQDQPANPPSPEPQHRPRSRLRAVLDAMTNRR